MMEKVRVRRPRPPEPTPKERAAWQVFLKMAEQLQGETRTELNPMLACELARLAAKGNPIAIRFKERLSVAAFKPREAAAAPKAPPSPRRISALKWGRPDAKKHTQGGQ